MGFCTADQLAILQKVVIRLQNTNKYVNPNVASSQCNLCKGVLSRARMLLDDPLAEAKIEGFVIAEICPLVTSIDDNKCRLLVKLFVPSLLHLLRSGMDPMLVCESLHLCVKESVSTQTVTPVPTPTLPRHEIDLPPFLMKQPSNGGSALRTEVVGELSFCQMCDVLLKVVRKRGAAFTTKPAVVTAMREVCMVFPDHIAHRCDQLVNAHGGELALAHFRHASSMSDTTCPLSACRRSLSDSNSLLFEPLEASRTTPRPTRDNSISCAFCKRLIKEAEDYLRRNHTEQELENYLISWCQSAPQQYRDECVSLIRQYLPYIIDALVMEADPSTICSGLHLCATEVYSKLLGRRRCTWGPSYWCSSVFNAHSCYAVEHCQKNVWLGPKPPRRNKPAINI
jgi:saposin